MRKANAITRELSSPLVRFDEKTEQIFLHEGSFILFSDQFDDNNDGPIGTTWKEQKNGQFINHPIDENGEIHSDITECAIIGRAGDQISPYHRAILFNIKTENPECIPGNYEYVKKLLEGYGIGIRTEAMNSLAMKVYLRDCTLKYYYFDSPCHYFPSLPFRHTYEREEYSDELLAKDIAATLAALFSVIPAPANLLELEVDNIDGSPYNENVVRLLNESGEFDFEFVSPPRFVFC